MPKPYRLFSTRPIPVDAETVQHEGKPHIRIRDRGRVLLCPVTKDGTKCLRPSKRSTVEDSTTISMSSFRKRLIHGSSGTLTWTWSSGHKCSVGYVVTWNNDAPALKVHYRWRDSEDIEIPVRLEVTPTQFGGQRWWFTCPLIVQGIPCNRRVGKLHLPPGSKYFGCRTCHKLTYRSCQEAHQAERVFGRLGFDPEVARLFSKRHLSR